MTVQKEDLKRLLKKFSRSRFRYLEVKDGPLAVTATQKANFPPGRRGDSRHEDLEPDTVPKPSIPAPGMLPPEADAVTPLTLRSPRVGHFFLSVKKGEPPVLAPGAEIKEGQVIGIIESIQLKHEVKADRGGVIEKTLVENGEAVEYGQPLARLKKSPEAK